MQNVEAAAKSTLDLFHSLVVKATMAEDQNYGSCRLPYGFSVLQEESFYNKEELYM